MTGTGSEKGMFDNFIVNGFKKLFPNLTPKKMTDPARSSLMGAISNFGTYAFGAYDDPKVEGFKEHTIQGNFVQHMRPDIIRKTMEGAMKIHLKGANNLRDADGIGRGHSDPYVNISLNGTQVISDVKFNTADPVWDATYYIFVRGEKLLPETDHNLKFTVFDQDSRKGIGRVMNSLDKDDHLGSATLDIRQLKSQRGVQEMTVKLIDERKNKTEKGKEKESTLSFSLEYITCTEALSQMDLEDTSDKWMDSDQSEDKSDEMLWSNLTLMTDLGFITGEPVAFITSEATGTQCWLHINEEANVVIVAFRGTEMTSLKDVLTDGMFLQTSMTATSRSTAYVMKPTDTLLDEGIKLHRGFRSAYDSVRETILRMVLDLTNWDSKWTVCLTGHSLGGALATLCAFEVANRKTPESATAWQQLMNTFGVVRDQKDNEFTGPKVGVMSFGAPKVGDIDFVEGFNKTVTESLRVVTSTDLVHFLPPFSLYKHVQYQVDVKPDGEVKLHGQTVQSAQEEAEAVNGAPVKDDKEKGKVTDRAFSRVNVASHLQPYYFHVVNEAVTKFFKNDLQLRGRPLRILRSREVSKPNAPEDD